MSKEHTFNGEETVTITKKEYDGLIKDSEFLLALQGAGVDNWGGYSDALESLEEINNE